VWPPLIRQAVILMGRIRVRDRIGLVPPVLEARSAVAVAVRESVEATMAEGDHDHA
jgi:hypothetical protein